MQRPVCNLRRIIVAGHSAGDPAPTYLPLIALKIFSSQITTEQLLEYQSAQSVIVEIVAIAPTPFFDSRKCFFCFLGGFSSHLFLDKKQTHKNSPQTDGGISNRRGGGLKREKT